MPYTEHVCSGAKVSPDQRDYCTIYYSIVIYEGVLSCFWLISLFSRALLSGSMFYSEALSGWDESDWGLLSGSNRSMFYSEALSGWDESDWGWKDEEEEKEKATEAVVNDSQSLAWIQECQISLSPAADLMAIACDDRLVLLARTYQKSWFVCKYTRKKEC